MAGEASFDRILVDQRVQLPEITLENPGKAGTYYVRTGAVNQEGQEEKFSFPQSFEIKDSSLSGSSP